MSMACIINVYKNVYNFIIYHFVKHEVFEAMMQYSSDMSAMHTLVHEQSPGLGSTFVCAHFTRHCAFAMNASTSSLVSMIWHLGTQLHATSGALPLVILHALDLLEAQLDLDLAAAE